MKAPLGEWIACLKDERLQHSEEINTYDVFEGRQPPRPQSELCQQLTEELVTAKVYFDNVLEHQVEDENFPKKLRSYLQRVGHLMDSMGASTQLRDSAEEEVESEQEEIIEEGDPTEINLLMFEHCVCSCCGVSQWEGAKFSDQYFFCSTLPYPLVGILLIGRGWTSLQFHSSCL
uniref:Uncharacterized protein n=1 Tax=Ditylenchus dipsaci TaxID=166011 RepID=A0A915EF36_9BILA